MPVRRLAAVVTVVSTLVLAVGAAGGVAPRLHVLDTMPRVVVRGTFFDPGEHLLVRLVGRGVMSRRVVADDQGAFRVSLRRPPALSCGRFLLQVRRPAAKTVAVRVGPPECAPLGDAGA